jgi:hypothetical protein
MDKQSETKPSFDEILNGNTVNKTPKTRNGYKTRTQARQAVGQNVASQTVGKFDNITDSLADKLTDNLAAQVEMKVSKSFVDGSFQEKLETRLFERFLGFNQQLENNLLALEASIEEMETSPLALPYVYQEEEALN